METVFKIALGVALAPVVGFILVMVLGAVGLFCLYLVGVVAALLNGHSIKDSLR